MSPATSALGARAALAAITGPEDLRRLPAEDLPGLAAQIRAFLVDTAARTGGHLGPNLGAVELTIAVHRVFDSARDSLVFDTGHQTYVHKILTGRAEAFATLRQEGGLSGYPSRAESRHDLIENSHASTALSYADGLAKAAALRGTAGRRVVAVVGDGALTGGMSWEALNNLGAAPERPVVVVLNDNGRSYSPTVGGIARHLAALRAGSGGPTVFEDLGLAYLGPVDGHDTAAVEAALRAAAALERPVVVHCVTAKGKGYAPAEADDSDHMHTVGAIDPGTGRPVRPAAPTWTSVFGEEVTAIGAERPDVVCVTGAMRLPAGLGPFAQRFPQRVYDVGIAEQHAVTSAAGLALGGLHPVVAVYAAFLGRAVDQVLTDVALHRLPVTFVLDRAGITGPDGASHHGMWDASLLPVVPGLALAAPRDCARLRELLREAVATEDGPTALRYPKASVGPDIPALCRAGGCDVLREDPGARVLLVAVGPMARPCLEAAADLAADGVPTAVVDPRWCAPLPAGLCALAEDRDLVVAVEDTCVTGALGGRLAQALANRPRPPRVLTQALPPRFLPHAARPRLLAEAGLDAAGIARRVRRHLSG
ncbi:1-deoxy-D-xylulose-5-phosphate synthase [Streptomonospora nanhaiensis]|uniref:1-deoxy-D-xylulose-5-phosphate synthase n=1 Tax=Streptomonospora nanhaiensis TaxID=1323731 RepID=UPI001C383732|nr:1-deoxy-D-xylulose-5-phosphate synthase [Streptomonospora nanhaiensis]MBV2366624.1 1-deoxy-D-xylulose-5-phosphate synthase [Streptomonospora nanhaiensis]